jgi:hypothetical protein
VDSCGIDSFHNVIHTDHRGTYADIHTRGLLGGTMSPILPSKLRGISSNSPDPEKYIQAIQKHLLANNVYSNSRKIFAQARQSDTILDHLVVAANKLDRSITNSMLLAEIKCRRTPRPAWSIPLAAASGAVKFWKTLISGIQTNTDVQSILRSQGKALKWDHIPLDANLSSARSGLKIAEKHLRTCRKEAKDLCQESLDE